MDMGTTTARVTVFSRKGCGACVATRRALDLKGIAYEVRDVTGNEDAIEQLREMGFQQLPVVTAEGMTAWSGMRPDKLDELAQLEGSNR